MPKPGFDITHPPYLSNNSGQPSYPMPSAYANGQPSYPQQSCPYPPQYPPQKQSDIGVYPSSYTLTNNSPLFPGSGQYPTSNVPSQYPPQTSPYSNFQPPPSYPPQPSYPPTQQASSVYPNMSAGSHGGSSQVPLQAAYPPISTTAYYQPTSTSLAQKKVRFFR